MCGDLKSSTKEKPCSSGVCAHDAQKGLEKRSLNDWKAQAAEHHQSSTDANPQVDALALE